MDRKIRNIVKHSKIDLRDEKIRCIFIVCLATTEKPAIFGAL